VFSSFRISLTVNSLCVKTVYLDERYESFWVKTSAICNVMRIFPLNKTEYGVRNQFVYVTGLLASFACFILHAFSIGDLFFPSIIVLCICKHARARGQRSGLRDSETLPVL
jgi:hypothetical protein